MTPDLRGYARVFLVKRAQHLSRGFDGHSPILITQHDSHPDQFLRALIALGFALRVANQALDLGTWHNPGGFFPIVERQLTLVGSRCSDAR